MNCLLNLKKQVYWHDCFVGCRENENERDCWQVYQATLECTEQLPQLATPLVKAGLTSLRTELHSSQSSVPSSTHSSPYSSPVS